MPLDAALVMGRWLFLGLLVLLLWQLYRAMQQDLRASVRVSAAVTASAARETRLVVLAGAALGEPGRAFLLREPHTLGRAKDNTIVLDDPFASSHHARVGLAAGRWCVEDLASTNGTLLNGERLQGAAYLAPGDEIRIGECALRFEQ